MGETFVAITGFEEFDDRLSYLRDKSAQKIGKAVSRRMAVVVAQGIRKEVPEELNVFGSNRGIGSRGSKSKMSSIQTAKAGIAVGSAGKNIPKIVNRGGKKGVGISARNLHWFALGTADRWTGSRKSGKRRVPTGNPRHFTGRIREEMYGGFVQRGAYNSGQRAIDEGRKTMERMIEQEVAIARGIH